jgi:D-alanyl-D-alanine dipeptidase
MQIRGREMLKYLRLYYNYFLVKWGFRKVLPAYFINKIKVADCGEELVQYQGVWVRKRVAAMLENAQRALPTHFEIKVVSGFRNETEQLALREKFGNKQRVAADSGHTTGGAVDVTLFYCGKEVDCGSKYLTFTPQTPTWSNALNRSQQRNRFILYNAMTQAGFVNYPLEWWHFCYGDKMYAAYKFEKKAFYGKAEIPWQPDLFKTE